ncbi:Sulfate adenylyltransferase [Planctomycetaceae bacterium]|nr:Sulfate adenylyltransferase [Planctomycetaceae bacterium]
MPTITEKIHKFTPRVLPPAEADAWAVSAKHVIALPLTDAGVGALIQLALGEFAPLTGFLEEADYLSVLLDGKLRDGTALAAPLTLAIAEEQRAEIARGQLVALTNLAGQVVGRLEVRSIYLRREHAESLARSGKTSSQRRAAISRSWLVGGPVDVLPGVIKRESHAEQLFPWGLS